MRGARSRLGFGLAVGGILLCPEVASAQAVSGTVTVSGVPSPSAVVDTAASGTVRVTRGPPWDKWCTASCLSSIPGLQARGALLRYLPPLVSPSDEAGYLEARMKQVLSDAVLKAARQVAGGWSNEALADLAVAIAAVITHDADGLQRAKGLGAAVARAGLAYALDKVVPSDGACIGPGRLDAIYEGLAVSASLERLEFPMRKGNVPPPCAATAKAAASWTDAAALGGLVPPEMVRAGDLLARKVDEARLVCGAVSMPPDAIAEALRGLPKAGEPLTVAAAGDTLAAARKSAEAARTVTEGEAGTCARSLQELAGLDVSPLTAFAQQGLAAAPLDTLSTMLRSVDRSSDVARLIGRIAADGGLSAQALRDLLRALATGAGVPTTGVLADAIDVMQTAVVDGPPATVQPDVLVAFLSEKYDVGEGGVAALKSLVMPTHWILELNGGLPSVSFQSINTTIVADGTVGYTSKSFGVVGSGGINYSDLTNSAGINEGDHPYGSLEAWWVSGGPMSPLRFEARLTGGIDYYDTTLIPAKAQPGSAYWIDYDSLMFRGTALVGLRWRANDRVSLQVLAGGGGQFETQDSSTAGGQSTYSLSEQQNVSAQGSARLLFRWRILPGWLGMRVRADGSYFTITRDTSGVQIAGSGAVTTSQQATEQDQQAELHGRLFLDADILSFAQFVPSVWGGFDYVGVSGPANSSSSTLPVVGIGIVRHTM